MPSIRYRHNYRGVVLNGIDSPESRGISGSTIPALLKDGSYRFFPFGGFLTLEFVQSNSLQRVKLPNIDGFSTDDHGLRDMTYIHQNQLLGAYIKGRLYVVLDRGKPVTLLGKEKGQ